MILLWNCHVCQEQFDKYDGGICSRCKKATCIKDLKIVDYDAKQGAAEWQHIVCVSCVAPAENAIPFRKRLLAEKRWMRLLRVAVT